MCATRACQVDVRHALTANLSLGDLDPALLADDTAMLEALVLSAKTLVVLDRAEDLRAEQAVALGLECPIVDRLRLLYLTEGPGTDHVRAGQSDANGIEVIDRVLILEQLE